MAKNSDSYDDLSVFYFSQMTAQSSGNNRLLFKGSK